jgi:hypothetical protein
MAQKACDAPAADRVTVKNKKKVVAGDRIESPTQGFSVLTSTGVPVRYLITQFQVIRRELGCQFIAIPSL